MQEQPEYTTMQILAKRRKQIEKLQLKAQANEEQSFLLRDFADQVLVAGLEKLTPIFVPNSVFVEEE